MTQSKRGCQGLAPPHCDTESSAISESRQSEKVTASEHDQTSNVQCAEPFPERNPSNHHRPGGARPVSGNRALRDRGHRPSARRCTRTTPPGFLACADTYRTKPAHPCHEHRSPEACDHLAAFWASASAASWKPSSPAGVGRWSPQPPERTQRLNFFVALHGPNDDIVGKAKKFFRYSFFRTPGVGCHATCRAPAPKPQGRPPASCLNRTGSLPPPFAPVAKSCCPIARSTPAAQRYRSGGQC